MRNPFNLIQVSIVCLSIVLTNALSPLPVHAGNPIEALIAFFKRKPTTITGKRGAGILCELTPKYSDFEFTKVWNRNPHIFWFQRSATIVLKSEDNGKDLLNQPIATLQQFTIGTNPLNPGKYQLFITNDQSIQAGYSRIQIVKDSEYKKVIQDLAALDSPGLTPEAIALKRFDYFIQKELIIDAVEVLFTLDHPSNESIALKNKIVENLCFMDPETGKIDPEKQFTY